ncbi:MAG: hypothetical protein ACOX87_00640 [Chloroflexota bacterium]
MANIDVSRSPVLEFDEAVQLYYDLLTQSKEMTEQVRLLRDKILRTLSAKKLERVQVDGYEAVRQIRHHPPQLNEDRAVEILEQHGRLEECQVEVLDEDKAREVIEDLFHHGALSKDELPYIYVKPTEALLVNKVQPEIEQIRERRKARRAA